MTIIQKCRLTQQQQEEEEEERHEAVLDLLGYAVGKKSQKERMVFLYKLFLSNSYVRGTTPKKNLVL